MQTSEKIVYIVSSSLDYSKLICADAGPEYASNLGWKYDSVDHATSYLNNGCIIIIDTRLDEEEYNMFYKLICENPDTEFIATVTDPYYEECIDKPLYKFLFKTTTCNNVRYLTQYQPTEIIKFLQDIKGDNSMFVLNYPYLKEKEVEQPFSERKNKIIFSGSISSSLYPERYQFWRSYTRSIWRLKIDTLKHPGYPGSGQHFAHSLVKNNYVSHLSKYQFMYLGASRCNLEFMKYSECAYAGCIPVGYFPGTFNEKLKKYVIPIDNNNLSKSLIKLFSIPQKELVEIAAGYRKEFSMLRDPNLLNEKFYTFLERKCELLTSHTNIH
jgi:hypothetical protein